MFSFNRLLDPKTAARGNWVFQNIVNSNQPFIAVNDSTLAVNLIHPFSPFYNDYVFRIVVLYLKKVLKNTAKISVVILWARVLLCL